MRRRRRKRAEKVGQEERQRGRGWCFGEVEEKRGEDDGWDGRLWDSALVLLLISLSRANSGKDGGMNY